MCKDFSGIITEKGEILWLKEDTADHQKIIDKYELKTNEDSKSWVRFEIHYICSATKVSRDRKDAKFQWDCQTLPNWAEKNAVQLIAKAWVAWDESRKNTVILENEIVDEVKDYYVAHCLGTVKSVFDNATIKSVSGNATIEYVYGNATIESVYGNATIKYVYGNATIKSVSGNATIKYVYGNATIKSVSGNATIKSVSGNATIKSVFDNATIEKIEENAYAIKDDVLYLAKGAKTKKIGKVPRTKKA